MALRKGRNCSAKEERTEKQHSHSENAVLRERLHELKTERGTAGKLSNRTLWLYQRKIRGIQNRAVAAKSRAVPPVKQRQALAPKQYNHHKGTRGLHLVLKGVYYDSMVVGYKDKEYRYRVRYAFVPCKFILTSRRA